MADNRRTKRHALPPPALEMAAPHSGSDGLFVCSGCGIIEGLEFGVFIMLVGKEGYENTLQRHRRSHKALAGESVAVLVAILLAGSVGVRRPLGRVVIQDLSWLTSPSSAGSFLDPDGCVLVGACNRRQPLIRRTGSSLREPSS